MHEVGCTDVAEQNCSYLARGDEVSSRIESVSTPGVLDAKSQKRVWLLNTGSLGTSEEQIPSQRIQDQRLAWMAQMNSNENDTRSGGRTETACRRVVWHDNHLD